jgi:hypothetical protein
MGGNAVKKPKNKGKNRIYLGDARTCVKVFKTWEKGWREPFKVGGKAGQQQLNRDK